MPLNLERSKVLMVSTYGNDLCAPLLQFFRHIYELLRGYHYFKRSEDIWAQQKLGIVGLS